jgi:hypothetical protein
MPVRRMIPMRCDRAAPPKSSGGSDFERDGFRQLEENLLALNGHLAGSFDPDPHRAAVDLDNGNADFRPNMKTLTELPAQN